MKKLYLAVFVVSYSWSLRAGDTASTISNEKFGLGISTSLISHTRWLNTSPYIIDNGSIIPFNLRTFSRFGLTLNWNCHKNLYVESGADYSIEDIPELADNTNFSPGSPYNQSIWLSYKVKRLQIPLGISYSKQNSTSLYVAIGVKSNFIFYENLNGFIKTQAYDTTNSEMQFDNLSAYINFGGNVFLLKNKLRLIYFFSLDSSPIHQEKKGIANFSYYKFGFNNLALLYNF